MLLAATLHAFRAEPVTFLHSQGQEQFRTGAIAPQHLGKQRERGDPIDIVVSEQDDALVSIDRDENAIDRGSHVRQQKGIAERAKTRLEEGVYFLSAGETLALQELGDAGNAADFRPRNFLVRLRARLRNNPTPFHRVVYW